MAYQDTQNKSSKTRKCPVYYFDIKKKNHDFENHLTATIYGFQSYFLSGVTGIKHHILTHGTCK